MKEQKKEESFSFDPMVVGAMRLGQWGAKYTTQQYISFIEGCLQLGLSDFDHADIYGHYTTEEEFGLAIKQVPSLREEINLITKCGIKMQSANRPDHHIKSYDLSAEHIIASVERSLKNFHTDRLDILLLHRPDVLMDPYEIAETFDRLKSDGKVLYFGVSNFTKEQFQSIHDLFPLITNQVEISVLRLEKFLDGTLQQCMDYQIQPMGWSPLGGGKLFGATDDLRIQSIQKQLAELAEKYNCHLDQLLYAFVMKHPAGIVPVLGTTQIDRIKRAVEALSIDISKEDWYQIWTAAIGKEIA